MSSSPEQPKKPAGGAYGQFMAEKRAEFQKQCAGQPVSAVSKLGSEKWKALSEAEKAPYQMAFEAAKKKYDVDMESFLAAGGVKQKGAAALRTEKRKAKEGKTKKAKDPNAPKKPVGGAYGCFLNAHREEFQKACPGDVTGVAKLAGQKWKDLPEADKEKYNKEYSAKRAAYEEAMKSYVPPATEDDNDENDDENDDDKEVAEPSPKKTRVSAKPTKTTKATKANESTGENVIIPPTVLAKAEKSDMVEKLRKLLIRDDIQSAKVSASNALSALEKANGLLHPARRALLGA